MLILDHAQLCEELTTTPRLVTFLFVLFEFYVISVHSSIMGALYVDINLYTDAKNFGRFDLRFLVALFDPDTMSTGTLDTFAARSDSHTKEEETDEEDEDEKQATCICEEGWRGVSHALILLGMYLGNHSGCKSQSSPDHFILTGE